MLDKRKNQFQQDQRPCYITLGIPCVLGPMDKKMSKPSMVARQARAVYVQLQLGMDDNEHPISSLQRKKKERELPAIRSSTRLWHNRGRGLRCCSCCSIHWGLLHHRRWLHAYVWYPALPFPQGEHAASVWVQFINTCQYHTLKRC